MIGGVERTKERKIFLVRINDRSAETLLAVINEHVLPGSIVHTDMWKSYDGIGDLLAYHNGPYRIIHYPIMGVHHRDPCILITINACNMMNKDTWL